MPQVRPALVDSHSHLDAGEFDLDRTAVVERARAAGVLRQLVPAVTAESWPKLRQVCTESPGLHPAYGLHPTFLEHHAPAHLDTLAEWLATEHPLAVGECGLDFYVEGLDRTAMAAYFDGQLRLAREHALPVIVHARRAVDAVIGAIRTAGGGELTGVIHSFPGSWQQASQLWDLGFCLGIGGPVTYPRANKLRQVVAEMPIEYLLLETDAPDQPNVDGRGQRNEPAKLTEVLAVVAELRGESIEAIAAATTANAERLFKLPT